ncbi:GNAT family N-acetyltransferase [Deinococcus lacus]|uniref:GNAT family N-acetyltransferase n=1 Tax=Deinococcus lacus TaxID=392561 RepID=A0ABW1YDF5_9DEIO
MLEAYGPLAYELTAQPDEAGVLQVLRRWFTRPEGRLGYGTALIAESQEGRVGLLVRYAGDDAERLDHPLRGHLRALGHPGDFPTEGRPGELYLDALAVAPAARGQGVGRQLLAAAKAEAQARGLRGAALLVEPGNPAQRLYERAGFQVRGRLQLPGHTGAHLDLFWSASTSP